MKYPSFPLDDYLSRIQFQGEVRPDLATLKALVRRHAQSIPFENLDVLGGKPVSLEPDDLIDKIVYGGRGGYCYENNGLLALVLEAVGFSFRRVSARPRIFPVLRPRTHMAIVVYLDEQRWLCDPAFGGAMPLEPICIDEPGTKIVQGYDRFRLTLDTQPGGEFGEYYLSTWRDDERDWQTQYSFSLAPQEAVDFIPGNYLNSTHPDSFFRKIPVLVLFTEQGRNILSADRLKIMRDGQTEVRMITPDEYPQVLRDYFLVSGDYPEAQTDWFGKS